MRSCWEIPAIALLVPLVLFLAAWLAASAAVLQQLQVFRAGPLLRAPPRYNRLSAGQVAAVVALYLVTAVIAAGTVRGVQLLLRGSASTATAPATLPGATASAPASAASSPATATRPAKSPAELATGLAVDTAAKFAGVLAILLLAQAAVVGGLAGFGLSRRQFWPGVRNGLLAGVLLAPWLMLVNMLTETLARLLRHGPPPMHPILQALRERPAVSTQLVLVAAALLIAPFAEELFFRGLLQTAFLRLARGRAAAKPPQGFPVNPDDPSWQQIPAPSEYPVATAGARWLVILTTSAVFASIHLTGTNFEVLPPLFLLAVALGYLYERTGNLWSAVTLHFLFNAASTTLFMVQLYSARA